MKALVDGRIREEEFSYLFDELKLDIKLIDPSKYVYPEISGHSDIFYAKIDDKIYHYAQIFQDKHFLMVLSK